MSELATCVFLKHQCEPLRESPLQQVPASAGCRPARALAARRAGRGRPGPKAAPPSLPRSCLRSHHVPRGHSSSRSPGALKLLPHSAPCNAHPGRARLSQARALFELAAAAAAAAVAMAEVEETLKRINSHKGVQGIVIMNSDAVPIRSTFDSATATKISASIKPLAEKARSVVRDLDPQNDLTFLRIRSKKNETLVRRCHRGQCCVRRRCCLRRQDTDNDGEHGLSVAPHNLLPRRALDRLLLTCACIIFRWRPTRTSSSLWSRTRMWSERGLCGVGVVGGTRRAGDQSAHGQEIRRGGRRAGTRAA